MISKLAPAGTAGFVLANGSMSSNTGGEGEIRKNLIENDLVECIVALPGQLFYKIIWTLSKVMPFKNIFK
jgi:type I restriction enzyme M protein